MKFDKFTCAVSSVGGLGTLFVVGSVVGIIYLSNAQAREFSDNNCVQTQEMRSTTSTNLAFTSDGKTIVTSGQKLQFKYTCDDKVRWK